MKTLLLSFLLTTIFFSKQTDAQLRSKKFFFSAVVTPEFKTTIPPISLLFEKGIAKVASLGLDFGVNYDSESSIDYHAATILFGARACGYVMPIISMASKKEVKAFGFDPYAGLLLNYYASSYTIHGSDFNPGTEFRPGAVIGTRWYPGDKRGFALLVEYGTTGITGGNIRFGITLGR